MAARIVTGVCLLLLGLRAALLPADERADPRGDDWPQWRGPLRDAVSRETGLLKSWPPEGPPLVWQADDLGRGYSTPSVAGGRVVGMGHRGDDEVVWALDARSGEELWQTRIAPAVGESGPTPQRGAGRRGRGIELDPRSTPCIDGDRVYALGVRGNLVCLDTATGRLVWGRSLVADFGGTPHYHGYTESPLVDGDRILISPGGRDTTLIALDKRTGDEVWRSRIPGDCSEYASAIVAEVEGRRMCIQFLERGLAGIDARDGRILWRIERPRGPTYSIATPLFHDNRVFAADTHSGGVLVQLTPSDEGVAADVVYRTLDMKNQHGGMVLVAGWLYGFNSTILTCLDFRTGEVAWSARSVGKGSLIFADGHLYVRGERGGMALVEATPAGYVEKGRFRPPQSGAGQAWPHPVIAGGRLYLRDQEFLLCYDLRPRR